ncbi:MAG: DNA polymerase III subunit epsilon [Rhizobiales bacterium]|jgi:DNA polymerase-3 subunit epsilon|nr:DNA polymerase III subunit epsilon [Hyphomicrobiales bacterium]MDQ3558991.1 DNA polymerase III subunit epsilon [Pseudomonadota bacterium]
MREIVVDTETTGLECLKGDRLIEIGCVELLNHIPTGRTFHAYINPRRAVSVDALHVHGLTDEFLRAHPCFEEHVDAFADFVGDSILIAHNAAFDRGFINMELGLCRRLVFEEHRFLDTLLLARRRHPNGPNSLDALCGRYGIDNSARAKHGALLDAEILAEVYLELLGGRQSSLALNSAIRSTGFAAQARPIPARGRLLAHRVTAEDQRAHAEFIGKLPAEPLWARYSYRGQAHPPA